ncbi:MAG TPA: hypothetical protein PLH18_06220 [Clostridia bacterium]|nr:hypothetical protein [Clostridia bacterium]
MPDSVTQGEFRRFLLKYHFLPKGRRKTLFVGFIDGRPRTVSFHYHKDRKYIPKGTLNAMAKQLGIEKDRHVDMVKDGSR